MKMRRVLAVTFCAAALLTAANLQAARNKTQSIRVPYAGTVAGTHLNRGEYRVKCETDGKTAKLTFLLDRKVVATVAGQVENRSQHYSINQVVYDTNPDGTRTITEIRLARSNEAIVFTE